MNPSTLEICKVDLFSPKETLEKKYTDNIVDRVMRIRDIYNHVLANPESKDKEIIDVILQRYPDVSRSSAYVDLGVIKALLPMISQNSRDFHRWRYNEMIMDAYRMAKRRSDTKTMERCATSYAKYNGVDKEEELKLPYDKIVPQRFVATMDVSVLGIKPIPNVYDKIEKLTRELAVEIPDIEDVDYETADMPQELFDPIDEPEDGKTDIL